MVTLAWGKSTHHDDSYIGQPRLPPELSSFFFSPSSFLLLSFFPLSIVLISLLFTSFLSPFSVRSFCFNALPSNLPFDKYFHYLSI